MQWQLCLALPSLGGLGTRPCLAAACAARCLVQPSFVPAAAHCAPAPLLQARRTQKVGICGKYGTRYGATLRKLLRKVEVQQHSKYTCVFCGKDSVKRVVTGIWKCGSCSKVQSGGAFVLATPAATSVRTNISRLRKARAEN